MAGNDTDGATDLVVPPEQRGQRLDRFLTAFLGSHSRSQLQKLIADGCVTVAGRTAKANLQLRDGDLVRVQLPDAAPSSVGSEALPVDILYQDEDLAVVNKPAGMVVHPAAGHSSGTLVNALLHHLPDLSGIGGEMRPGIVHRLDRGTSGVMVVAKNDAAHQELARQFHDREVEKEYIALVWGVVQAGRRIDAAIGRDPVGPAEDVARSKHARDAVTRITRALHLPGLTLCQVAIHTGRTHQIRVHLSAIGHPGGRRLDRTAACTAGWPATSAPCSGSSGRSCTPRGWRSRTRATAAAWSSPPRCPTTCRTSSTRCRHWPATVEGELRT